MQSFIFADYPLIPLMIKSPSVETTPKTADWVAELEKIPASLVGPDGDGCRWGSISGLSEYKQLKAFISNLLTQAVEDNEIDFTKRMEQMARDVRQELVGEIRKEIGFIRLGIDACKEDADKLSGNELHYVFGKSQALKIEKQRLDDLLQKLSTEKVYK